MPAAFLAGKWSPASPWNLLFTQGFDGISAVAHGHNICELWCECMDCISGNAFGHVPCRSLRCFCVQLQPRMLIAYPNGTVVDYSHSDGTGVLAQIQDPSERGADYGPSPPPFVLCMSCVCYALLDIPSGGGGVHFWLFPSGM